MIAGHSDRATFPEIQMSWFRTTRQTTMNVGFRKPSGIRRFPQRGKSFAAASKVFLLLLAGLAVCNPTTADNVFKADFTISPSSPAPGQPVSFTDATRGLPTSWSWDFGDGSALLSCNNSNCRNPMHTYAVAGTYTLMLRIILLRPGDDAPLRIHRPFRPSHQERSRLTAGGAAGSAEQSRGNRFLVDHDEPPLVGQLEQRDGIQDRTQDGDQRNVCRDSQAGSRSELLQRPGSGPDDTVLLPGEGD